MILSYLYFIMYQKRREKKNQSSADVDYADNMSSIYMAGSETGSITVMSRLVESEAEVARQQT